MSNPEVVDTSRQVSILPPHIRPAGTCSWLESEKAADEDHEAVLSMRGFQVDQRAAIRNHLQELCKTVGVQLRALTPTHFIAAAKTCVESGSDLVRHTMKGMLDLYRGLDKNIAEINEELHVEATRGALVAVPPKETMFVRLTSPERVPLMVIRGRGDK